MNKDYLCNREYALKLEYIISELELRRNLYVQQNPNKDTKQMDYKIKVLYDIQGYHFELFEHLEALKKENQRLTIENQKHLAIYNHSKLEKI